MRTPLTAASWLVALLSVQSCNQPAEFQRSGNVPQQPPVVTPNPEQAEETTADQQLPPPVIPEVVEPGAVFQRLFLTAEVDRVSDRFQAGSKLSSVTIPIRENQRQESLQLPVAESHTENIRHETTRKTERFTETIQPLPLDLVIVVDDSESMKDAIEKVKNNLIRIVDRLGDTHWRIAVTTTSIHIPRRRTNPRREVPCILGVLDRFENGSAEDFENLAGKIGIDGHDDERGLERSIRALGCKHNGKKWTRDNAMLGMVVVSDEDDCTSTRSIKPIDCNGRRSEDIDYSLFTKKLKSYGKNYYNSKFYALVAVPGTQQDNRHEIAKSCFNKNPNMGTNRKIYFTPGRIYEKAVEDTGGIMACIWEDSYDSIFSRISDDLIANVKKQFPLQHAPIRDGLVVKVDGTDVTSKVTIDGNLLGLNQIPQVGQTIEVEYSYLSNDPLEEHQLAQLPLAGSVKVTVDGKVLAANEFTLSEGGKITFSSPVAMGSMVGIEFKSLRETIFAKLNPAIDYSSIIAYQDGQEFKDYQVDHKTGYLTVDRSKISTNIQPIIVKYSISEGTILHYPVDRARLAGVFKGVFWDLDMAEPVEGAVLIGDEVVFVDGSVAVDDSVQAMFQTSTQEGNYPLSFLPVKGRKIDIRLPSHCPKGSAVVSGQQLELSCKLKLNEGVDVRYAKLVAKKTIFNFEQVTDPDNCTWEVTLVGSDTPLKFLREGTTIFVDGDLPVDAQVKVVARVKAKEAAE